MDEYHTIADKTMEDLLETLEELLDAEADTGFEVDYHVSPKYLMLDTVNADLSSLNIERSTHTQTWVARNLCHQQAAAQQANLAVLSS